MPSLFAHYRGRIRLPILRQLGNHATLLSPVNALFYLSSAVPNTPFIAVQQFPALEQLRDNWQTIRDEAVALQANGFFGPIQSIAEADVAYGSFLKRGWRRFFLTWYSATPQPSAQLHCPKTLALLARIPEVKAALFAYLPAKGKLTPHRDPYAGSLRYQLGLITPNSEQCKIVVDGEPYSWRDGEHVIFDETFVHHAHNETQTHRLVLFCDIERPLRFVWVQKLNRFLAKHVMSAANAANMPGEKVGWLNRGVSVFSTFRVALKQFKRSYRMVFKITKYALVIVLLYCFITWR